MLSTRAGKTPNHDYTITKRAKNQRCLRGSRTMKTTIYTLTGKQNGEIELPSQFNEKPRGDLIKKMFLKSQEQAPYGASPEAGKRYSAKLSRRRRDYKTGYGRGMARSPRKVLWRRGRQFGYVGALAPN